MRRIPRESRGSMDIGQDIVIAGYAGLCGAALIAERRMSELKEHFSESYIKSIASEEASVRALSDFNRYGITEYEAVHEGGILTALWNISGAYMRGMEIYLRKIPLTQSTVEICEYYGLNPYYLYSDKCAVLIADNGLHTVSVLEKTGIHGIVVGRVNSGIKREILGGESITYMDRPIPDELYKVIQ